MTKERGAWVAQSVKRLTSAQVMISRFVGSSSMAGSMLTSQSLESNSDSVSPSLSAPPPLALSLKNKETLKNSFLKWIDNMNRHFPQEDIQMANRHVKRCSKK